MKYCFYQVPLIPDSKHSYHYKIFLLSPTARKFLVVLVGLVLSVSSYGQYTYDIDGNLAKDLDKGWDSIYYNHLNLIERIDLHDGRRVHYTYDALGSKLSKKVIDGTIERTTYYVGSFEYEQAAPDSATTLQRLSHEEGWLTPKEEDATSFSYAYNLQDHLGNNRVSFMGEEAPTAVSMNNTASSLVARIIQTAGFYPFGGIWEGSQFVSSIKKNLYPLTGKEAQEELG